MHRSYIRKFETFFCLILILFVGISFFFDAVRLISVKNNIVNQNVIRKLCSFELKKFQTGRNTSYLFVLDDGDTIFVVDELLENENIINSNEKLNFTYVKPRGGIHLAYTCSEITSQSESIEFVNPTLALREVKLGIIVNFMISIPIILFYVILLIYKLIKGRLSRT